MEHKDQITNEELNKKFKNQFELVNYAIKLAENMLKTGRGPRVKMEAQNRALQILEEISTGNDIFDEIVVETEVVPLAPRVHQNSEEYSLDKKRSKSSMFNEEKPKRPRKILVE
ncbi:MAG: DNA-directed RNA polymerase subunit omega [Parachlamydiaceae bacterium]|nr:DNA-directed RNA polymerase subunit omega [Parachlamydiaceae bacterium]